LAASAVVLAPARAAALAATSVRIVRRPRCLLNALFIRFPSLVPLSLVAVHLSSRDLLIQGLGTDSRRDRFMIGPAFTEELFSEWRVGNRQHAEQE
jgi:hypothetical protein